MPLLTQLVHKVALKEKETHMQDLPQLARLQLPYDRMPVRAARDQSVIDALQPRLGRIILHRQYARRMKPISPHDTSRPQIKANSNATSQTRYESIAIELNSIDAIGEGSAIGMFDNRWRSHRGIAQQRSLNLMHLESTIPPITIQDGARHVEMTPAYPRMTFSIVVHSTNFLRIEAVGHGRR